MLWMAHLFQYFWQEDAIESQNKDEVIFDYICHDGGGKPFHLMVEEQVGESRELKGSEELTALNL